MRGTSIDQPAPPTVFRFTPAQNAETPNGQLTSLWRLGALAFCLLCIFAPSKSRSEDAGPSTESGASTQLDDVQRAFQKVVEHASPTVVSIKVKRKCIPATTSADGNEKAATTQTVLVNGSGTIISDGGAILTNEHVVQSATRIEVIFHDGRSELAEVVGVDAHADLAVLRTNRHDLPSARICDWSGVARGQWALAIGNPYGLGGDGRACVSVGVISNLARRLPGLGEQDDRHYQDMIQTTAVINPGNSGGPLFNLRGELVGIVTAMHTRAAADQGIGFAIPMSPSRVRRVEDLVSGRRPAYGYVGLTVRDPTADERRTAELDSGGAIIEEIEPGGPADLAGLQEGDALARLDDEPIASAAALSERIGDARIGSPVRAELRRGAATLELSLMVQERRIDRVATLRGSAVLWRGMRLAALGEDSAARQRDPGMVVVEVLRGTPAEKAGMQVGDRVRRAGSIELSSLGAFRRAMRDRTGEVELYVVGRGVVRLGP